MDSASRKLTWLVVLVVGLVGLAFPASVAFAADDCGSAGCGKGVTDPVGQFILPGILSFAVGEGASEGGTFALAPMQVEVPALNTTTSISGLTFGTGIPGWDALTISQNQPSGGQAFMISGAQATIRGPSTGYSTDASAYIELHPSADFQAQGTISASYNGVARWAGVSIVDASALINTGPLSLSVSALNSDASALTADTVQVGVPSAGMSATISGLEVANGRADWDAFVLAQDQTIKLGDAATISGLQVSVAGPGKGYSTQASGQVEVPALNTTTSISGLTFGTGIPGWDALTISQNQPSGGQAFTISGAQATIREPSTGYSTDASAHIELHPSADFQAQGTISASYNGVARWAGVSIVDASALINTGPLSLSVAGLNSDASALTADTVQVGVPSASMSATISGLEVANGRADWDAFVLARDQTIELGDAATISGLQVSVAGPGKGYSTQASGQVELNAGNVAHAVGTVQIIYDPSTGLTSLAVTDMSASVTTDALSVELTGMNYQGSTLTIANAAEKSPPLRLEGAVSDITIGGGKATGFREAQLKFRPDPNAGGALSGFDLTVANVPGGYTITTQTTVSSQAASQ